MYVKHNDYDNDIIAMLILKCIMIQKKCIIAIKFCMPVVWNRDHLN